MFQTVGGCWRQVTWESCDNKKMQLMWNIFLEVVLRLVLGIVLGQANKNRDCYSKLTFITDFSKQIWWVGRNYRSPEGTSPVERRWQDFTGRSNCVSSHHQLVREHCGLYDNSSTCRCHFKLCFPHKSSSSVTISAVITLDCLPSALQWQPRTTSISQALLVCLFAFSHGGWEPWQCPSTSPLPLFESLQNNNFKPLMF